DGVLRCCSTVAGLTYPEGRGVSMTQPGYQEGGEVLWWWKVAQHLDEAQQALANAMAHNLDDQQATFGLQDKLREGQVILLSIFQMKGLVPASEVPAGQVSVAPMDVLVEQAVTKPED